jgi:hypothetical protein
MIETRSLQVSSGGRVGETALYRAIRSRTEPFFIETRVCIQRTTLRVTSNTVEPRGKLNMHKITLALLAAAACMATSVVRADASAPVDGDTAPLEVIDPATETDPGAGVDPGNTEDPGVAPEVIIDDPQTPVDSKEPDGGGAGPTFGGSTDGSGSPEEEQVYTTMGGRPDDCMECRNLTTTTVDDAPMIEAPTPEVLEGIEDGSSTGVDIMEPTQRRSATQR